MHISAEITASFKPMKSTGKILINVSAEVALCNLKILLNLQSLNKSRLAVLYKPHH